MFRVECLGFHHLPPPKKDSRTLHPEGFGGLSGLRLAAGVRVWV